MGAEGFFCLFLFEKIYWLKFWVFGPFSQEGEPVCSPGRDWASPSTVVSTKGRKGEKGEEGSFSFFLDRNKGSRDRVKKAVPKAGGASMHFSSAGSG